MARASTPLSPMSTSAASAQSMGEKGGAAGRRGAGGRELARGGGGGGPRPAAPPRRGVLFLPPRFPVVAPGRFFPLHGDRSGGAVAGRGGGGPAGDRGAGVGFHPRLWRLAAGPPGLADHRAGA